VHSHAQPCTVTPILQSRQHFGKRSQPFLWEGPSCILHQEREKFFCVYMKWLIYVEKCKLSLALYKESQRWYNINHEFGALLISVIRSTHGSIWSKYVKYMYENITVKSITLSNWDMLIEFFKDLPMVPIFWLGLYLSSSISDLEKHKQCFLKAQRA
jgi:hypothetical protein